jgi:hypothetical protein
LPAVTVRRAGVTVPVPATYVKVCPARTAPLHVLVPVWGPTGVVLVTVVTHVGNVVGTTVGL